MSTNPKTINWYNDNAEAYAAHVRDPKSSVYHSLYEKPAMYSLLPNLTDVKVISLGCGSGEDSHYLMSAGARSSVGIDVSEGLIKIAQASYPDCEFRVMDMERLEFPDETFDFAYSSLAIHYLEDWSQTFAEVFRVLKPNSFFLFSCGHPIWSAMEEIENSEKQEIQQLSFVTHKKSQTVEVTGNYLQRRPLDEALHHPDVITWHKPIGEVVSEATKAGFLINQFVEPKPHEKMREISRIDYDKLTRVPYFMILRLLKSGRG